MKESIHDDWYVINDPDQLDTPALVIYPDRMDLNIQKILQMAGSPERLRPHVKTNKSADVIKHLLSFGITKFKCATIAEAELLALCNAPDILIAYQPTAQMADRIIALIQQYPKSKFSFLVDCKATALLISKKTHTLEKKLIIYIDLDVGMGRTGIDIAQAFDLYVFCIQLKCYDIEGLHAYDGHIHDISLQERSVKCAHYLSSIDKLKTSLMQHGYPSVTVVAGGTPTFPILIKHHDIVCSPGTFIFWDAGYGHRYQEQDFMLAALVICRIISLPGADKLCLDMGYKAVAADQPLDRRLILLNAPELKIISQSEEHLVMQGEAHHHYKIGDLLYAVPYHICPTVALYDEAITVINHKREVNWPILGRKRKITI